MSASPHAERRRDRARRRRGGRGASAPGDLVLVTGELGAGKTTFVRGACRALGVEGPVVSPDVHDRAGATRRPSGRAVSHLDLYRLADMDDGGGGPARRLPDAGCLCLRRVAGGRRRGAAASPSCGWRFATPEATSARSIWTGAARRAKRSVRRVLDVALGLLLASRAVRRPARPRPRSRLNARAPANRVLGF